MRRLYGEILWLILLAAVAAIMAGLLAGGDILLYLAPRMTPAVWFGAAVLVILAGHQSVRVIRAWKRRGEETGTHRFMGSLVFTIPVVLFLTATPNESTSSTLTNRNVKVLGLAAATESAVPSPAPQASPEPKTQAPASSARPAATASPQPRNTPEAAAATPAADRVDPADAAPCALERFRVEYDASADAFTDCLYASADEMEGRTLTLYGFVYKDDTFPENTLLISRMYVSCCAADASLVGFHVRVEDAGQFEKDEWIRVTATVRVFALEYGGGVYDFPLLTGGTVALCETPETEDAYIYP